MTWSLRIEIPGRLMSQNNAYYNVPRKGRKLTPVAERWKQQVAETVYIDSIRARSDDYLKARAALPCRIALDIELCDEWDTQAGKPRRKDVDNTKLLVDAVCDGLGLSGDEWVYDYSVHKRPLLHDRPVMVVTVQPWADTES